jgi:hypothetical protein
MREMGKAKDSCTYEIQEGVCWVDGYLEKMLAGRMNYSKAFRDTRAQDDVCDLSLRKVKLQHLIFPL